MSSQGKPLDMVVNHGGIPALNEKGEHIYLYWGMVDLLQEFDLAHKIQYAWKGIRHGCNRLPDVSVNPPDKYRIRFTEYMLKSAFASVPDTDVKSPEQNTKKQWKAAMHKALRQHKTV